MKKVLSLLLVLTLVVGMSTVAFAAYTVTKTPDTSVTGFNDAVGLSNGEYDFTTVHPGDSKVFPLATSTSPFEIKEGNPPTATTPTLLKKVMPKVVSRIRVSKGSNVIKTAELNWGGDAKVARLEVEFIKPFPSNNTDGQEFDFWVYPVVDGKAWDYETYGAHFYGTLENYEIEVDEGTDFIDLYNHQIANIQATIRNIEYDLGPDGNASDVILVGRAIKGQKYWGVANTDISDADDELMNTHDIDQVYHLDQRGGLDKVTSYVKFANATKDDYIFDGDLNFLGMGNSTSIPYRTTYYIADHMIEVASADEPVPEDEPDEVADIPVISPDSGGVSAPAGLFDNPSTGA